MVVDLIILAIILICVYLGYQRGLIGVAFKFLSLVISIILAVILHGPVSNFVINNTTIDENLQQAIAEKIDFSNYENKTSQEIQGEENNIPNVLMKKLEETIQDTVNTAKGNVQNAVAKQIADMIINVGILILLYIIIKAILFFINIIGDVLSKLPIVSQVNMVGGIVYGLLEGLLIVYIILAVCLVITPFMQTTVILDTINSSNLGKVLYNNNILLKFIS